jgi:hypothetical protein
MGSNLGRFERKRFRERRLAQWKAAELSQEEYCRLNRISLKSFPLPGLCGIEANPAKRIINYLPLNLSER